MKDIKVYVIAYIDNLSNMPDDIELVKDTALAHYVQQMIIDDRITDDSVRIFYKDHADGVKTESDAVELLELDGYYVNKRTIYK